MRVPGNASVTIRRTEILRDSQDVQATPAAKGTGGEGGGGVEMKEAERKLAGADGGILGFGQTPDATGKINPFTSKDSELDLRDFGATSADLAPKGLDKGALPQNLDEAFSAIDEAHETAGAQMERGEDAQALLGTEGLQQTLEVREDIDVDPTADATAWGEESTGADLARRGLKSDGDDLDKRFKLELNEHPVSPLEDDLNRILDRTRHVGHIDHASGRNGDAAS